MLEDLGLKNSDIVVFRYAVRHPGCSVSHVIEATGLARGAIKACLERLCAKGLLMAGEQDTMQPNPIGPEVVLERLRVDIDAEYNEKRKEAASLHGELSRIVGEGLLCASRESDPPVEVLTDSGATRLQLLALTGHARHELLRMCTKSDRDRQGVSDLRYSTGGELKALRRGVSVRIIYPSSSLLGDRPLVLDGIDTNAMRVVASPPVGLHVFDRRVAVVEGGSDDGSGRSFVVHGQALVRVLHTFFETWWDMSRMAASEVDSGHTPTGEDLALLQYLSDGAKDDNVARHLGVSVRTVRRKISYLLERLNASSRFQAGVLAARRGWI